MAEISETKVTRRIIEYLESLGFGRITIEEKVQLGKHRIGRADIVAYDEDNQAFLVVEVKRDLSDSLDQFHPAIDEAYSFATALGARFFAVSDSVRYRWFQLLQDQEDVQVITLTSPPSVTESHVEREDEYPIVAFKKSADWDSIIWRLYDELRSEVASSDALQVVQELLLAKHYDEERAGVAQVYKFQVLPKETPEDTKARIVNLADQALADIEAEDIGAAHLRRLDSSLLQKLVLELQPYKLMGLDATVFDSLLSREVKGGFFTPRAVATAMADMLECSTNDTILDPVVRTGSLLTAVWSRDLQTKIDDGIETPGIVGVAQNRSMAMMARMNLLLNGVRNFKIVEGDVLESDTQHELAGLGFFGFDCIVANPPMGGRRRLEEYKKLAGKLSQRRGSAPNEVLYLLQMVDLLKPGGKAAILVPDGLLFGTRDSHVREYILSVAHLVAVLSLAGGVFQPFSMVKASILILEKKGEAAPTDRPTLMMRVAEKAPKAGRTENIDTEGLALAAQTFRAFLSTGKVGKESRLRLDATVVDRFSSENGYRWDFAAYAPEYVRLLEQLERGPHRLVRLGDIARIRLGTRVQRQDTGDIPVITASNIHLQGLSSDAQKFTSAPSSPDEYLKPGDILLARVGRDYPVAVVPENFAPAVAGWPLIVISLKSESDVQNEYLVAVLQHEVVKVQLEHMAVGAAQVRVTPHLLNDVKIPILPQVEQKTVVDHMTKVEEHRILVAERLEQVSNLIDKALMGTGNEA